MRQSPGAISGSARTTRRPSKPAARAISSSSARARLLQSVVDAHDHVRRRHQVPEAIGGERGELGERLARDQLGRELAGDRDRHLDRLGLEPRLDRGEAAVELGERGRDAFERGGGALLGFGLGGREAVVVAGRLRLGELGRVLASAIADLPRSAAPTPKSLSNRNLAGDLMRGAGAVQ